jgi:hypothetical protein
MVVGNHSLGVLNYSCTSWRLEERQPRASERHRLINRPMPVLGQTDRMVLQSLSLSLLYVYVEAIIYDGLKVYICACVCACVCVCCLDGLGGPGREKRNRRWGIARAIGATVT